MNFISAHDNRWHTPADADGPLARPSPQPQALLTLAQWLAVRHEWPAELPTGLLLPNTTDVLTLGYDLPRLALVALQFPKWTDGRAYSQARLLRARLRYEGELRATGEVVVDMLPMLLRTGFSSVQLREGESVDSARRQLQTFEAYYQADQLDARPWFQRLRPSPDHARQP